MRGIVRMLSALTIVSLGLGVAPHSGAQQASNAAGVKDKPIELNGFLCKDIMRMSGDERTIAIAAFHGYFLGKKGATSYVSNKLSKMTDDFTEYCLDNPKAKALDTFSRFAK